MSSTINTTEIGQITDQSLQPNKFYGLLGIEGLTNVTAGCVYNATDYVFEFRKSANVTAGVATGKIWFYENKTSPTYKIEMVAPASMAANYTLTLPDVAPPLAASALVFNAAGESSWATVLSSLTELGTDSKYHILTSNPSGLVEECEELDTDEVLVGNTAAKATPRRFAADTTGTTWSISATEVKLVLPQGLASTDAPTFQNLTVNGNITISGNVDGVDVSAHVTDTTTHGTTGDIVGTSDLQVLTNKTIDGDLNTISNLQVADFKTEAPNANKVLGFATTTGAPEATSISNRHVASDAAIGWAKIGDAGGPTLTTGTADPQSSAIDAFKGSLYIRTTSGTLYRKLDDGSTTNWEIVQASVSSPLVLTVAPTGGQYKEIQDAMDAILDAALNKQYLIQVYPGTYTKPVTLKSYVHIQGIGTGTGIATLTATTTPLSGTIQNDAFSAVSGISVVCNPTSDNQSCVDITGTIGFNDVFFALNTSSNVSYDAVKLSTSSIAALSNCSVAISDTYSVSTKEKSGVRLGGSGQYINGNVSMRFNVVGGSADHAGWRIDSTGEVVLTSIALIYKNTGAFSGHAHGVEFTSTSSSVRNVAQGDIRLTGNGSGTAGAFVLDYSGTGAEVTFTGMAVTVNNFANMYITDTTVGNTQKIWLQSVNRDLGKNGAGLAIITPYDELKTGFVEWSSVAGSPDYWNYVPGSKQFTLTRRCTGIVKDSPVLIPAQGPITLGADYTTQYIYANSLGVLASTPTANEALYRDNVVLFQLYSDGTDFLVAKENHPYKFTTAISVAWHRLFGSLLEGTGAVVTAVGAASARTIQIVGADVLTDHGLDTIIPDSAGAAVNWSVCYTTSSGMALLPPAAALPGQFNNTAGAGSMDNTNDFVVFRLGVIKDSIKSSSPQYIARPHTAGFGNITAARTACNSNTVAFFDTELRKLEIVQLGFAILNADNTGGGTLDELIIAKQTFGANFNSAAVATSASSVNTNVSTFNGALSPADTTVQLALQTLNDRLNQNLNTTSSPTFTAVNTNTINESTSAAGVTIDSVLLKDGTVTGTGVVLEDPGAGTNKITLQAPTLAGNYTLTLPTGQSTGTQILANNGSGTLSWISAGTGDVVGPASATDNAVVRWDGTTGKLVKNSTAATIDNSGNASFLSTTLTGGSAGNGKIWYSGGIQFGNNVGNVTDAGVWTLGASGVAGLGVLGSRSTAAANQMSIGCGASGAGEAIVWGPDTSTYGKLTFYTTKSNGSGTINAGGYDTAGAWTFPAGIVSPVSVAVSTATGFNYIKSTGAYGGALAGRQSGADTLLMANASWNTFNADSVVGTTAAAGIGSTCLSLGVSSAGNAFTFSAKDTASTTPATFASYFDKTLGSCTYAGAWTLGPTSPATTLYHTLNGHLSFGDGVYANIAGFRTIGNKASSILVNTTAAANNSLIIYAGMWFDGTNNKASFANNAGTRLSIGASDEDNDTVFLLRKYWDGDYTFAADATIDATVGLASCTAAGAWTLGPSGQTDSDVLANKSNGRFTPGADNTYNLGSLAYRWQAVYAVNGTIQTSDARLKKNIESLGNTLDKVNLLKPSKWESKFEDYALASSGFIAQDLITVFPELVQQTCEEIKDVKNVLAVSVTGSEMVAILVKAIQELSAKLQAEKARNDALEARLAALENK